jgi:hypothetical protein
MKIITDGFIALCLVSLPPLAQTPSVITMDQEPHHHLALQNDFVKVFKVEVAPGDSIVLHRHDQNTVAIAIGEQLVTVGIPGKPDVHQKNADAQVRLQAGGYVHSTHVDGDMPYRTIAVELLRPQTNFHNVCAVVLSGQPMNCPTEGAKPSAASIRLPLLESGETRVHLVRVLPHESLNLTESPVPPGASQVVVALDPAWISSQSPDGLGQKLQPGDFIWIDGGTSGHGRLFQNRSEKEARIIEIIFPHAP